MAQIVLKRLTVIYYYSVGDLQSPYNPGVIALTELGSFLALESSQNHRIHYTLIVLLMTQKQNF